MVRVCRPTECVEISAAHVIIAAGSRPNRPTELPRSNNVPLPFTKMRVVCATEMGGLVTLPTAVAIIGGGVIAVEYATVLAQLGVGVSLICSDKGMLPYRTHFDIDICLEPTFTFDSCTYQYLTRAYFKI